MKLFHKHKWIESERFYAPPSYQVGNGLSQTVMQQMVFGITTIVYECLICGKMKTVEVLGQSLKESP